MELSTNTQLSVVIINFRTPAMTCDCLASLLPELNITLHRVIVVDNHSEDDSVSFITEWLASNDPDNVVTLVESPDNTGFSGGNNTGILATDAEYYLLLNSDTIVREGAINKLLQTIKEYPDVGLLGPRLEWLDGRSQQSCFSFHSPLTEFIRSANQGPLSKLFEKYVIAKPVSDNIQYYDWVSFACVLVRKQVFENIGLLDDSFFMYYEDVEFSHRATKAGWKVLYQPEAHVVHLRGGSSPLKSQAKQRKKLPRYFYESRTRYFYLIYGRLGLFVANLMWILGSSIAVFREKLSKEYISIDSKGQWTDTWINFTNPNANYIHPKDYDKT